MTTLDRRSDATRLTPLILLVGVLGAGKTTLLRSCLPELVRRGVVPSVVLNDYANARVDAQTLEGLTDQLTPIAGTCVCCDSRGELLRALVAGPRGPRQVMLVEANGTVDAADLIEILAAERLLKEYTLPIQVSVVDASRWQRRHWDNGLEAQQVRTAAVVVANRSDAVSSARLTEVREAIRRLAPGAAIVGPEALCGELEWLGASAAALGAHPGSTWAADHSHGHADGHSHHHSPHHFSALEVPLAQPVDRGLLSAWLRGLPSEVVRAKGVAQLEDGGWVYFARLDDPDSVSLRSISGVDLDPVAILIGPRLDPAIAADAPRRVAGEGADRGR